MNQKGLSSLALLMILVLGIGLLWETNEYIVKYNTSQSSHKEKVAKQPLQTFCPTGEPGNCNDSNDQFLLTE